jgi:hypothetical protein
MDVQTADLFCDHRFGFVDSAGAFFLLWPPLTILIEFLKNYNQAAKKRTAAGYEH